MTRCPCGNTARFGESQCSRCQNLDNRREQEIAPLDAVLHASYDIPEGPMRRFADAVVELMEGRS